MLTLQTNSHAIQGTLQGRSVVISCRYALEGGVKEAPKARASGGYGGGGMLPQGLGNAIPHVFQGKGSNQSIKNANYQYLCCLFVTLWYY